MATTELETLNSALKARCDRAEEIFQNLEEETAPTQEQLDTLNEELGGLKGEIDGLNAQIKAAEQRADMRAGVKQHLARIGQPVAPMQFEAGAGGVKALGATLAESDAYKSWLLQNAPGGNIPEMNAHSGRLPASSPVLVPGGLKTIITGSSSWAVPADTSAGALTVPEHRGVVGEGVWMAPLQVVDMVRKVPTDSDVIYYVRISSVTEAAAPTAEATATSGSSGLKPEGGMVFDVEQAIVRTIPVWTAITRQAASNSSQLRDRVETYLRWDVRREINDQIISGTGTGQDFTGIEALPNVLTQAFSSDILTTARKARTNLLLNGRTFPTGWAFHPTDWETFDLEQDAEERYYFGGPLGMGTPRLWGVPVAEDEAVTLGQGILGDWRRAVLADREQTTIRISDSHDNFFTRNMLAILCEARAAFYVEQDQAFVLVDLAA